jgi:hypothetical protein
LLRNKEIHRALASMGLRGDKDGWQGDGKEAHKRSD